LLQTEATDVFFAVTKLFQSKDSNLRRMVYLIIKEICPSADEVIIVTSSLMKDMNSPIDLYRANAIRVLCNITDAGLLGQIERYLKQAVVDKNAVVSSAALVSGIHLLEVVSLVRSIFFQSNSLSFYWLQVNSDIVRRWNNEVQEAMSSKNPVVQFHAISLLHKIRQSDRLAITKLVSQLTRNSVRSPLAHSLIIRYVSKVISESKASDCEGEARPFFDYLENCLRNKSEMVIFEAVRYSSETTLRRQIIPLLFLAMCNPFLAGRSST